jgi:hypothetical protein
VRLLVVLVQIALQGTIGSSLAYVMALGMAMAPAADRTEIALMVIFGGLAVGFLTWLFGLLVDRISFLRLVLTVAFSMLGLFASYLIVAPMLWRPPVWPAIFAAVATPLLGAMAGYYWLWGK